MQGGHSSLPLLCLFQTLGGSREPGPGAPPGPVARGQSLQPGPDSKPHHGSAPSSWPTSQPGLPGVRAHGQGGAGVLLSPTCALALLRARSFPKSCPLWVFVLLSSSFSSCSCCFCQGTLSSPGPALSSGLSVFRGGCSLSSDAAALGSCRCSWE